MQPETYEIKISDLPGEIREIAKLVGLKPALKIATEYSGETVYIPKYDAITRAVRDRAIRAEFDGGNWKALARKFNLTTRLIRQIVQDSR